MSRTISWPFPGALATLLICPLISFAQGSNPGQADLILTGGTIRTMDRACPVVEALAIRGQEITGAGTLRQLESLHGPDTRILRLEDHELAVPGLIDSHAHFLGLGESLMMLDLSGARTWEEIAGQVREAAQRLPAGQWIVGRGWHQSKWTSPPPGSHDGYPDNRLLDEAAPDHPVLLTHSSGHMAIANRYALMRAGLDRDSPAPAGGELLRRADGELSGVLRETAQGPVQRILTRELAQASPELRAARFRAAVQLAGLECWRNGITSFHDAGTSIADVIRLQSLARSGELPVRLYVMVRDSPEAIERAMPQVRCVGLGSGFLTVRALKRSIDGALGPHGAWLLAPYADLHGSAGLNTDDVELVRRTARLALDMDLQMCVHAIGDRANREVLDLYGQLLGPRGKKSDHRWRIEHAQHLDPADVPRFADLGVVAAMQGVHCTSDAVFVVQRLGTLRAGQGAYVWRSLLDSGARICNGTDAPVEHIDPIASLVASVTRRLPDGTSFFPEQCMTREEALRSYTIDAAWAAFEESQKGSLVPGKLADITILSRDFLTCSDAELDGLRVTRTFLAGREVWSAGTDRGDSDGPQDHSP